MLISYSYLKVHSTKNKLVACPPYFLYLIDIIITLIFHVNLCLKLLKKFWYESEQKVEQWEEGRPCLAFVCLFCFEIGDPRLKWIIQEDGEIDDNGGGRGTSRRETVQKASWDGIQRSLEGGIHLWLEGQYFIPHFTEGEKEG